MTDLPSDMPVCQTIELQLMGQPATNNRWGAGSLRPARVVLTYLDDRRLAHLYGTWIREDGEHTDDPIDQLYRHDDDWPDWITSLADKHSPQHSTAEQAIARVEQACHELPYEYARLILDALENKEPTA